jgi:peptidoglycan hydrolase-like protein with peptidoglycan-binding domain
MTKKIVTAACALALGVAWTMAPAFAADDTAKDKMERAKDKTETKVEHAKDKTKEGMDTAKDKVGNAVDKTKEKAADIKDTIKNKVTGRKGSDDIRQAQQALMDKGMNPGPIDGKMGPRTKAALSEYQQKENLKVTGRLDSETKAKLVSASVSTKADTTTPAASPSTTTAPAAGAAPTGPAADQNANMPKKQTQ